MRTLRLQAPVVIAVPESSESQWKDIIVDHSQFPRCHGRLENASHEGHGENPFCGDRVHLQMLIDENGMVEKVMFEATGCAISLASASLLSANLAGKDSDQASELFQGVHAMLTGKTEQPGNDLGELEALMLVKQYPARVKCASLVWHVMKNALLGTQDVATTE